MQKGLKMVKMIGVGVGKSSENVHNSAETKHRVECLVLKCWSEREVLFVIQIT